MDMSVFNCKCCGFNNFKPEIITYNQNLLTILSWYYQDKVEAEVLSGCRCRKHNEKIGGAPNSYHVRGMAEDIMFKINGEPLPSIEVAYLVQYKANFLKATHFFGIGAMNMSLHLDIRPQLKTWITKNGAYVYGKDFKELVKGA